MTAGVTLPFWLVVLAGLLALIGLLDRLLVPSVRWFIRNRANKVLDEVGSRLRIEIRPFQQTRRQVLIDRLLYDEKVQQAAAAYAREQNMPREVVMARIQGYAREIVPAFNAYFYFRVGYWLGRKIARLLYRVRVGYTDNDGLARVPPDATVVFVMNHRSNMDYILAAYLVADQAALSYAVGEWARIWPLQQLIRSMGAYFVRRNSRDELYRKVLERYIAMATEAGVTQAVYPEGNLSRDGRMRAPKLGALDYMTRGFDPDGERDLVFIPLGINYDRTLEDRTLLLALEENAKKTGALVATWNTLAFAARQARADDQERMAPLWLRLRQLRHTGVDARVPARTRPRFAQAAEGRALRAHRRARQPPDAKRRQTDSGAAGAAGGAGIRAQPRQGAVRTRNQGGSGDHDRTPRSGGRPCLYPAARPRLRDHCGAAHDAAAAHGGGARRPVRRGSCGIDAAALLREFHRASAGAVIRRGGSPRVKLRPALQWRSAPASGC
jgi:1-acyl-sn-glycerol-3-phosphate acyltransferase